MPFPLAVFFALGVVSESGSSWSEPSVVGLDFFLDLGVALDFDGVRLEGVFLALGREASKSSSEACVG